MGIKYYAGVGSRNTPAHILSTMSRLAMALARQGYILRSGGAEGADKAFERGAGKRKSIFRPEDASPQAMDLAGRFHPAWEKCGDYIRRLHGRNVYQVLGLAFHDRACHSKFVVCWTPDGCTTHGHRTIKTGGTGTAISIATAYGIPVFNLSRPEHLHRVQKFIQ